MFNYSKNRIFSLSSIRRTEFIFIIIGLLFYSGGIVNLLEEFSLNPIIKILRNILLLGSFYGLLSSLKQTRKSLKNGCWIWPLVLLVAISFTWSLNPALSIQIIRSEFIPSTIFGIYFASRYNRKEIFRIIYITTLIAAITSLLVVIVFPAIGQHPFDDRNFPGAWRGIFKHKNAFGINLTLAFLCLEIKILYQNHKFFLKDTALFLMIFFEIILSKSISSLINSSIVLLFLYIFKRFIWRGKIAVVILYFLTILLIAVSITVFTFWTPILIALGLDPTLSARTLIWEYVIENHISERPIFGFGIGSIWKNPAFFEGLIQAAHHAPSHSHSGYIDLILDIGYAGLFSFFLSLFPLLFNALKLAYKTTKAEEAWPLGFVATLLISNITESLLVSSTSLTWILYVATSCSDLNNIANNTRATEHSSS